MAEILDQWQSCDAYKIQCRLSNDERLTFTIAEEPANVQAEADSMEAAHLAHLAEQEQWEVVGEQP